MDKLQDREESPCIFWIKAISMDSKKSNALFYKGIVLGKMKRHEEALNCFEKRIQKNNLVT